MSAGLVAAGIGAIAMSAFSIASGICAGLSPNPGSQGQAAGIRLFAGRIAAIATLFSAAWVAGRIAVPLQDLFLSAAAIGLGILLPATIGGIWWSRANRHGALAAILMGAFTFAFLLEMRSYGIDFRPSSGDEFRIVLPGLAGLPDVIHMAACAALSGGLALVAISLATGQSVEPERLDAIRRPDTPPAFPDSFA
jgi:cation/acetate symporter